VELGDQLQVTFTNQAGEFVLHSVRPGRQGLSARGGSFEPVQASIVVPRSGSADVTIQFRQIQATVSSIEVIGESAESTLEKPGSLFLVSREELRQSHPMDANELLRRVPGVTLREDSGPVAMRLNIGIRGLNPDRSRSVLMLEDGLPISLAPYGEPEMYYSPPIERMSRIEVLKGSGQIIHGPQTVGGVVNFITPDPPSSTRGEVEVSGGQRGFFTGRMQVGGSSDDQTAGWLLGYLHKQGDGFRSLFFDVDGVQAKLTLTCDPIGAL
jgi:Fe(3+) dicitrate transport protein